MVRCVVSDSWFFRPSARQDYRSLARSAWSKALLGSPVRSADALRSKIGDKDFRATTIHSSPQTLAAIAPDSEISASPILDEKSSLMPLTTSPMLLTLCVMRHTIS